MPGPGRGIKTFRAKSSMSAADCPQRRRDRRWNGGDLTCRYRRRRRRSDAPSARHTSCLTPLWRWRSGRGGLPGLRDGACAQRVVVAREIGCRAGIGRDVIARPMGPATVGACGGAAWWNVGTADRSAAPGTCVGGGARVDHTAQGGPVGRDPFAMRRGPAASGSTRHAKKKRAHWARLGTRLRRRRQRYSMA